MTNPDELQNLMGRTAVDREGNKIGKIGQIYLDDASGAPQWVTISTGLFGNKESFAPIGGYRLDGDDVMLSVTKDQVKDAPNMDADGHLGDDENDRLYSYYQGAGDQGAGDQGAGDQGAGSGDGQAREDYTDLDRTDSGDQSDGDAAGGYASDGDAGAGYSSDGAASDGAADAVGHDTSGPNTDDAMTRSEERLNVGTEKVESGRARLRKYVVTEDVTTTVPVSHEEVRLEREPITDANAGDAMSGGDITEEEHEVTLHAERPVVEKETVPVERVRLNTETVTENHEVTEQIRKEQIDEPDTTS